MKSLSKFISALLIASLVLLAACAPGKGRQVVKYCDKGMHDLEKLRDASLVSGDEVEKIRPFVADIRAAGEEFDNVERTDASTKEERLSKKERLHALSQQIVQSAERLNSEGVLHIKNEKVRSDVQKALAIAEIVLDFSD